MKIVKFQIPKTIWKDKSIPKEAKYIYSYIYAKGLRKNLELLEKLKYLVFQEYDTGMYTITLN